MTAREVQKLSGARTPIDRMKTGGPGTIDTMKVDNAPQRRRRWAWRSLVALVLVAATLTGLNVALGRYLEVRAADEAACRLPEGASVLGVKVGGSALLALIRGRFESIEVHSRGFALGPDSGVRADVIVRMRNVLIDRHAAFEDRIGSVELQVGLGAAALERLRPASADDPGLTGLVISDSTVSTTVTEAGMPVTVVLRPSIANGDVRLTPVSVRIGSRTFAPELLDNVRGHPTLTTASGGLLRPRTVDVPHLMPRVDPVSVQVVDGQLRLRLGVDDEGIIGYLAENAERSAARSACS